jgi:hypothetical protein
LTTDQVDDRWSVAGLAIVHLIAAFEMELV